MFDEISLPFDVAELVEAGGELLGVVSGFVLLGLAFMFAPKIIWILRRSIISYGRQKDSLNQTDERFKTAKAVSGAGHIGIREYKYRHGKM